MDVTEALTAAVALWADFPVDAPDRPVVCTEPGLRETGYVSDQAKIAFGARRLQIAAGVPDAAVASLVAAIGSLEPTNGHALLVTGAVRVDYGFDTDRGPRLLMAWSLEVTDSIGPVVVLDVDERARLWKSPLPVGRAGTAWLGSGGTRLRYRFVGSPQEYTDYDGAAVVASPTAVAIAPRRHELTSGPRAAYAQEREVEVRLDEPLGGRVLVGAAGYPIEVLDDAAAPRTPAG